MCDFASLEGLLEDELPITFLDIWRAAGGWDLRRRLDDATVRGLVRVFDSPHITLGGRARLAPILKLCAQKRVEEWRRGNRFLRVADHQTWVRIKAGQPIYVRLPLEISEKRRPEVQAPKGAQVVWRQCLEGPLGWDLEVRCAQEGAWALTLLWPKSRAALKDNALSACLPSANSLGCAHEVVFWVHANL